MRHHAVIFDLDGTLLDTLGDIAAAGNHMLREMGHPTRPLGDYRRLAGQGVHRLVSDALRTDNRTQVERGVGHVMDHYRTNDRRTARPFDGAPGMLDVLAEAGVRMAVLSNKPDASTRHAVGEHLGRWAFDAVVGAVDHRPVKPDPAALGALFDATGWARDGVAYVGDTAADMITGRGGGLMTVGVTWGFRGEDELREHGADAIIHRPSDLPPLLV